MIKALFFAQLAEQANADAIEVDFRAELTARALVDVLADQIGPEAVATLQHDVVMLSVNQQMADWDQILNDGDEVGFLPPFSGG